MQTIHNLQNLENYQSFSRRNPAETTSLDEFTAEAIPQHRLKSNYSLAKHGISFDFRTCDLRIDDKAYFFARMSVISTTLLKRYSASP